jgi:hypothetical protein
VEDEDDDLDWDQEMLRVEGRSGAAFNIAYDDDGYFDIIAVEDGDHYFAGDGISIDIDRKFFCEKMYYYDDALGLFDIAKVNGEIAFKTGNIYIVDGDEDYDDMLASFEELLDEFGFDYDAEGYLYKSFFEGLAGSVTVSDTAYVEPALPSAALVADLAVAIPQTGSVSSIGFALIALAVTAAVAVRKAK